MFGTLSKATATAILAIQSVVNAAPAATDTDSSASSAPTGATYASSFDIKTAWVNLRPYSDADGFSLSPGVPIGCELSQTHVLHRHAQRYPTGYKTDSGIMELFGSKVANWSSAHPDEPVGSGPLSFLNNWEYLLGEDVLLPTGAATEDTSGAAFWAKYGRLLYRAGPEVQAWKPELNVFPNGTARATPVFRTTNQQRIRESARWWLSGFFGNEGANNSYSQYDLVIIPEGDDLNNTFAAGDSCGNQGTQGDEAALKLIRMYSATAQARLATYFPAGFNLTDFDVRAMMSMCPYETAALGGSSFCSLFTEREWKHYAYTTDLNFYGIFGMGSTTGRARGIGYVNELAARLENRLIYTSHSSVNVSYDSNTSTFPVAGQPVFMDMSHDDIIIGTMAALGMDYFRYPDEHGMPVTENPPERHFRLDQVAPFGARLVSEIWTCPCGTEFDDESLQDVLYTNPDISSAGREEGNEKRDYIRFVLNNAPVPTDGVPGCEEAENGFCDVESFLGGVPRMREMAEYAFACYGNYSVDGEVGNGRPPSGSGSGI